MTIIKCKMCGGDIQRTEDQSYSTCDSCGSMMTFPRVSDDQRANLFNRANHFRRLSEFDKAIAAYESILNLDDTDAEAHWGVMLSSYGIEYVEDPASGERIPTCHRVQLDNILSDADYLAVIENAPDRYSRTLYKEEAYRIADIQKGILALSSQEKPYDVFICYKETTEGGSRTPDSALAQEVYYQLTQEGCKVFFSRITLEDKLGQQYEPYIFAALNSAKVMVVIGTQAEYINAVWVKNEWSRFLALMKKDRTKLLIPCYRGMEAYDLPEALSMLQSQDMGKIGFMQDLVRGIKKVVDAGKAKLGANDDEKTLEAVAALGVQSLLTRAQLFLEDGDFKSAAEYAEKVLDIDPKYAPAYIVRLQASLSLRNEEELGRVTSPLEQHGDYQKAVRFAASRPKEVYLGYAVASAAATTAAAAAAAATAAAAAATAAAEFDRMSSVGNMVSFGVYEQGNNASNDKVAIKWRVLKREGSKALLIAADNLDCQPYNVDCKSVTWETCTLRAWLNSSFINTAFTQKDRKAIAITTLQNDDNKKRGTAGGNATQDNVFLLSEAEAEGLFKSDADRIAKNTAYAKAQGAYTNKDGVGWWWLRSPGYITGRAAYVSRNGSINRSGCSIDYVIYSVRPALWLDLSLF